MTKTGKPSRGDGLNVEIVDPTNDRKLFVAIHLAQSGFDSLLDLGVRNRRALRGSKRITAEQEDNQDGSAILL